jgi:hypothetical protein
VDQVEATTAHMDAKAGDAMKHNELLRPSPIR